MGKQLQSMLGHEIHQGSQQYQRLFTGKRLQGMRGHKIHQGSQQPQRLSARERLQSILGHEIHQRSQQPQRLSVRERLQGMLGYEILDPLRIRFSILPQRPTNRFLEEKRLRFQMRHNGLL